MNAKAHTHGVCLLAIVACAVVVNPSAASAQALIKVNDDVFFRLGVLAQTWGDLLQDQTGGYEQNLYLRRIRMLLTGQVAPDVTFFFQTDNANLGKTSATTVKGFSGAFSIIDAWFEWKFAEEFAIDAGEMLVPFARAELTRASSFLTVDTSPVAGVFNVPTQTNAYRDTGFQLHGYLGGGHFEYRGGLFQGVRQAGSRNSPLLAAYLQYDFLDTETGYTFPGTYLGTKKIVAVSGGYTSQNSYRSYSGDLFTNLPVNAGDELAGQVEWTHYDGRNFLASVPDQNDYLAQLGYYFAAARSQPYLEYQSFRYVDPTQQINGKNQFGVGLNYYVHGQSLKVTGQVMRIEPRNAALRRTNEVTVQLQMFYY